MLQMKTQRINCWEADVKGFTNAVGAGMRRNGLLLIALQWDRNRGVKYLLYKPCRILTLTASFHAQPVKLPVSRYPRAPSLDAAHQFTLCMPGLLPKPMSEPSWNACAVILLGRQFLQNDFQ